MNLKNAECLGNLPSSIPPLVLRMISPDIEKVYDALQKGIVTLIVHKAKIYAIKDEEQKDEEI